MKENIVHEIETILSYNFNNRLLLEQAFTRRSYAKEHPGKQDNEVLEFIGDGVLSNYVLKCLVDSYTNVEDNKPLVSSKSEQQLTDFKNKLIQRSMLASKIDELNLAQYLQVGKGDSQQEVIKQDSVKEDLFEAIVGAVAIDSDFDEDEIEELIDLMLDPYSYIESNFKDTSENYIGKLQEWYQKKKMGLPPYEYEDLWDENNSRQAMWLYGNDYRDQVYHWRFKLTLWDKTFTSEADSRKVAKMEIAKEVIDYLGENNLFFTPTDIIGEPSEDRAVNQLQELFQKGYISEAQYSYEELFDNGHFWKVSCTVEGYEYFFYETATSKKEAKKAAAFYMLQHILEEGFK